MTSEEQVILSLGSNMGNRKLHLERAMQAIEESIGNIEKNSSIYESQSWGYKDDDYLNMVLVISTNLQPMEILKRCQAIEKELGRMRAKTGYEARTIDIDILFYKNLVIRMPDLKVPHPKIAERKFVLIPLNEICPEFIHPIKRIAISEMLSRCKDSLSVRVFS